MPRTLGEVAKAVLGANLIEARGKTGWNQSVAAVRAGVPRTRLNLWENGHEAPGAEGLIRLAIAYDCQIDALLGGVDEGYDAIIERRVPIDVQQFYRSKLRKLQLLTAKAMGITSGLIAESHAPMPSGPVAVPATAAGKSASAHARREPVKKPKPLKKK